MNTTKYVKIIPILLAVFVAVSSTISAQNLEEFEKKVTEFTLDNGLHFIIIERHDAPVVSFYTHVDVGGIDEPKGNTGIAHIFEHLAFKGDDYVGTTNWKEEQKVIDQMDAAYRSWLHESYQPQPDSTVLKAKWDEFKSLQEKAKSYVKNNEYSEIVDRNGGTGVNASTSSDNTDYYLSLPSNKIELWFSLESGRFLTPTFREFYVEKEVVREERKMRTESSPTGRLFEEFLAVAFTAHPYGRPVVGWDSDITATSIEDAKEFYRKYYVPSNITIGIAGDVDPKQAKKLAETYFGKMPGKGVQSPPVTTIEPEQRGERRFDMVDASQPIMMIGYHAVSNTDPDFEALTLLNRVLFSGRTSIVYKSLVEEKQLALQVQYSDGFPGSKDPGLAVILARPNRDVELDTLEQAIYDEIEKVKEGNITQEQLDRVRTNLRANTIRGLANNMGLAYNFVNTHVSQGDWRDVFNQLDRYESVSVDDLIEVAKKYFVKKHRTVGRIVNAES